MPRSEAVNSRDMELKASKITAVDFFDDLASPYARKRFFWGFILICVFCVIVIYVTRSVLPEGAVQDVVDAVAIQVLAASLIILAFYGLYMHFIGPNPGLREVTVIRPRDIGERMAQLPLNARHYIFWGRSGAYFRVHPLLVLDEQSRKQKLITDVEVLLPDPTDERLINSYQEILASLGEHPGGNPLVANVLATSIACAVVNANNKYIKIKLLYSNFLPAFRVDISDNGAILTQDDPGKSALFFDSGSEFYEMLRTTVRNEMNVSREVNWDESLFTGRGLDAKCCDKETLNAFGIQVTNVALQQEVAQLIMKRRHRYQ
jgi:hypothetical protein